MSTSSETEMGRAYKVVDAFSAEPLKGNPVAVVLDAQGLSGDEMQAIARWTNLSETTFLLPPKDARADYRLRIFTPLSELPFAGHPTLGSAHAGIEAGRASPRAGRLVQECGAGLIDIAIGDGRLSFQLPEAKVADLTAADVDELEAALGAGVLRSAALAAIDVGPTWILAQLDSVEALLALQPDLARSAVLERRLGAVGVTLFAAGDGQTIEVRSFAPSSGIGEDPVCGSGNGAVAVFRRLRGLIPGSGTVYEAAQGRCVGRDGRIFVEIAADGTVRIGGACVTTVEGVLKT